MLETAAASASTTTGSKSVAEQRLSSATASSTGRALRYGRSRQLAATPLGDRDRLASLLLGSSFLAVSVPLAVFAIRASASTFMPLGNAPISGKGGSAHDRFAISAASARCCDFLTRWLNHPNGGSRYSGAAETEDRHSGSYCVLGLFEEWVLWQRILLSDA